MNVILGGGLAGLAAAHRFTETGRPATVIEKGAEVGGLARTISHQGHRFDLGGHRFLSDNPATLALVRELLDQDLLTVNRVSRIRLGGRFVDYPLNPLNAVRGLGLGNACAILLDYLQERLSPGPARETISLEDWVVANFGRRMFELYFRDYSEKVWGVKCSRISRDWVARRIDGLSLGRAIRHALFRASGRGIKTLSDLFFYPRQGIGRLPARMAEIIGRGNRIMTATEVEAVFHSSSTITGLEIKQGRQSSLLRGTGRYLSSIPLTLLLSRMRPFPPEAVRAAAAGISFRSLVVVALMIRRPRVTDLTWLYLPEREIPFGRIHEPTNWSPELAPPDRTHLVAEYFCDRDDATWQKDDAVLAATTARHLARLGFIDQDEVDGYHVVRVPYAYPVFGIGYAERIRVITDWLDRFENLELIGRSGGYEYLNMDHAMESGIRAADRVIAGAEGRISYPEKIAAAPDRS